MNYKISQETYDQMSAIFGAELPENLEVTDFKDTLINKAISALHTYKAHNAHEPKAMTVSPEIAKRLEDEIEKLERLKKHTVRKPFEKNRFMGLEVRISRSVGDGFIFTQT